MKKLILGMFVILMVVPTGIAHAAFPDVPLDYKYVNSINYVQEQGIVNGFTDGTYKPDRLITRAEFTKVLINTKFDWHVYGENEFDILPEEGIFTCLERNGYRRYEGNANAGDGYWVNIKNVFPDVPADHKFAPYICVAKEEGIILDIRMVLINLQ